MAISRTLRVLLVIGSGLALELVMPARRVVVPGVASGRRQAIYAGQVEPARTDGHDGEHGSYPPVAVDVAPDPGSRRPGVVGWVRRWRPKEAPPSRPEPSDAGAEKAPGPAVGESWWSSPVPSAAVGESWWPRSDGIPEGTGVPGTIGRLTGLSPGWGQEHHRARVRLGPGREPRADPRPTGPATAPDGPTPPTGSAEYVS